jgi:hypothetical protein
MAFLPSQPDALVLAGALNFRDLGGYHTVDGRRTRSGLVYRSNSLQELTQDDVARLRWDLRVATVLDLRSPKEIARDGHGPFMDEGVRYINIPVLHERNDSGRPGAIAHGLVERYLSYLRAGGDNVVEALRTIAEDDVLPVVFHCSAGKDRTGVFAALLLGSCRRGRRDGGVRLRRQAARPRRDHRLPPPPPDLRRCRRRHAA